VKASFAVKMTLVWMFVVFLQMIPVNMGIEGSVYKYKDTSRIVESLTCFMKEMKA